MGTVPREVLPSPFFFKTVFLPLYKPIIVIRIIVEARCGDSSTWDVRSEVCKFKASSIVRPCQKKKKLV
jgi:hypothetical protein